ncbi:hypothetical protein PR202_ga14569 [Eleusine coracana subsp. coracana]|uniref:Uncharacterized protein n=1 Tax=Eleusine coracana subsp. coracana TaxID=191504 RepID=A0AAV5CHR7_ELECO|nr:hypothetical protein PR202_ga14569 [Eleusine coracana subsp. coracana]
MYLLNNRKSTPGDGTSRQQARFRRKEAGRNTGGHAIRRSKRPLLPRDLGQNGTERERAVLRAWQVHFCLNFSFLNCICRSPAYGLTDRVHALSAGRLVKLRPNRPAGIVLRNGQHGGGRRCRLCCSG